MLSYVKQNVEINKGNTIVCHTFAKEIASQPMTFGIAAIINDCKTVSKPVTVSEKEYNFSAEHLFN
jgi:hypothetical protein